MDRKQRVKVGPVGVAGVLALCMAGCAVDGDFEGSFDDPTAGGGTGKSDDPGADTGGSDGGSDDGEPSDDGDGQEYVEEAKKEFPTYLDLHEKVVVRTCTPNEGVCHNKKEYPDLHTPQTMLGMLGSPCNLAEEDPMKIYNGCEPVGDTIRFADGNNVQFESEVAFVELHDDGMGTITSATVYLRDAIPNGMLNPMAGETVVFQRQTGVGMLTVGELVGVSYMAGSDALVIGDYSLLTDGEKTLLETDLVAGDPNQDGVFGGSEDPYDLLRPGDPWKSYLLQRLQGNVPGSPMPLANTPLSSAEIVAIACWIEGAAEPEGADPHAEIDYDNCEYAAEFGEPPEDSGATFSGHVQPILTARCATDGCHGSVASAAGLDLTEGNARANLLRPSGQDPEADLVTPGNPTNSYLITKLTGNGAAGVQMPKDAEALSDEELEIIRLWISYGAPDD